MAYRNVYIALFASMLISTGCATTDGASSVDEQVRIEEQVRIPESSEVSTKSGETVIIYGQRGRDCNSKSAPTFDWIPTRAVTREPEHGSLSNGGVGKRRSGRCGKVVPVRAVAYTPDADFTGTDLVTFWGKETVIIEVQP